MVSKFVKAFIINSLGKIQVVRISRKTLFNYLKTPAKQSGKRVWISPENYKKLKKKATEKVFEREHKFTKERRISYWKYKFKHNIQFYPPDVEEVEKQIIKDVKIVKNKAPLHIRQRIAVKVIEKMYGEQIQEMHLSSRSYGRRKGDWELMIDDIIEKLANIRKLEAGSGTLEGNSELILKEVFVLYFKT